MALIPFADDPKNNPSQELLDALNRQTLKLNVTRMIANSYAAQKALEGVGAMIMRGKLDPKLRELAILRTAKACGSNYEWMHHVVVGKGEGVTQEQIDNIEKPDAKCFNETERLVVRLCGEMAKNVKGSREAVLALNEKLGPSVLVELIMVSGFYGSLARLLETTEVELDDFAGKIDVFKANRR
jgi:alkylhydroperoxidase family enzyme